MIYIVKQWRYKWDDSYVFELEATYKAFESREKAKEYIENDICEKSTIDTVEEDFLNKNLFEVFRGKYGDKYQILELELNC